MRTFRDPDSHYYLDNDEWLRRHDLHVSLRPDRERLEKQDQEIRFLAPLWKGREARWYRRRGYYKSDEERRVIVVELPRTKIGEYGDSWRGAKVGIAVREDDGTWRPTRVNWENLG